MLIRKTDRQRGKSLDEDLYIDVMVQVCSALIVHPGGHDDAFLCWRKGRVTEFDRHRDKQIAILTRRQIDRHNRITDCSLECMKER